MFEDEKGLDLESLLTDGEGYQSHGRETVEIRSSYQRQSITAHRTTKAVTNRGHTTFYSVNGKRGMSPIFFFVQDKKVFKS
ncbi:MAG: hypothetical protein DRR19_01920 [Candidatus Parabeggiatoa sp. nov. 1]|nr:MAG: hypothetical protein DRR19_01920 [Gammaproteobacteria bacterium]